MGDRRFDEAYDGVAGSKDRVAAIRALTDTEVVHALAAASRKMDAYLANVLAVEVLRRRRRERAMHFGILGGLAFGVVLRTVLLYLEGDEVIGVPLWIASLGAFAPGVIVGFAIFFVLRQRVEV